MLDWNDLRLVLAVARARGAAGAAKALVVHPSTVFRRLGSLEDGLGVRLFERLPEGYVPTAAGDEACRVAERLEADVAALDRRIAGRDTRPSGTVRVTTTDTLLAQLTPALAAFRAAHDEIELRVIVDNRFLDLARHDADVAVRPAAEPPDTLVGRRLARIATTIYGAAAYLANHPAGDDLAAHDWIGLDESLTHLPTARWLRQTVPGASVHTRVNTLMAAVEAAKAGLGLALLPCFLGDAAPQLRRVRPPLPDWDTALWLLTHEDLRHVARVRALLDFLPVALAPARKSLEGGG
ncbi:MAG TPA: LysR substrate-binding domain-containing protein [Kiloniellales bacterium]|jgi:DNA-binding transcriptional LysR family regulator